MSTIQQITKKENLMFSPNNISEIIKFAEYIKGSALLPAKFLNKPADIVLGILVCLRLGLDPITGLHQLTILHGKLTMATDAMIALVRSHPDFEDMNETFDEATMTATCILKRKGCSPIIGKFSQKDAENAKLWGKKNKSKTTNELVDSPWITYPARMLQMRARSFAIRDGFPDATNGVLPREEVEDYQHVDEPKPVKPIVQPLKKIEITEPKQTQEILEAHVVIDEIPLEKKLKAMEQEMKDNTIQKVLKAFIEKYNVPETTVQKWLNKAKTNDVMDFSDHIATTCIRYIDDNYKLENNLEAMIDGTKFTLENGIMKKKHSLAKILKALMEQYNVPKTDLEKWLNKKIDNVMDLSEEDATTCIDDLERYYRGGKEEDIIVMIDGKQVTIPIKNWLRESIMPYEIAGNNEAMEYYMK